MTDPVTTRKIAVGGSRGLNNLRLSSKELTIGAMMMKKPRRSVAVTLFAALAATSLLIPDAAAQGKKATPIPLWYEDRLVTGLLIRTAEPGQPNFNPLPPGDWHIEFPDGSRASAFSRVTPIGADRSAYSFVLMAPPAPLERLEGALEEQSRTLAGELEKLRALLGGSR